ncbi:hypothetical protein C8R47DRAFT_1148167 [Mycena vitilis]|nr:hypothetical protein C8R47DRAFT_1148167 [Mycena vitilis]
MATTTGIFRSPEKPDRHVQMPYPSGPIDLYAASKESDGDLSWDVGTVQEEEGPDGLQIVARRPVKSDRPAARKALVGALFEDKLNATKTINEIVKDAVQDTLQPALRAIQAELVLLQKTAIEKMQLGVEKGETLVKEVDVIELHETWSLTIQGYNDVIFDTERSPGAGARAVVLTPVEKEFLKGHECGYITRLFNPGTKTIAAPQGANVRDEQAIREAAKVAALNAKIVAAAGKALNILEPVEQTLCRRAFYEYNQGRRARNRLQHPAPDTATAIQRAKFLPKALHDTLVSFLATNPQRIRLPNESPLINLEIFSSTATYKSAAEYRADLVALKKEKDAAEQHLVELEERFAAA